MMCHGRSIMQCARCETGCGPIFSSRCHTSVHYTTISALYIFFFFWRELSADIDFSFLFSCACFSGVFSSAGDKHLYHQRIHFLQTIESTLCFRSF